MKKKKQNKMGWLSAAYETARRIVHQIRRSGIPSLIGGALFTVAGMKAKNMDMEGGGIGMLAYGAVRAYRTGQAWRRYRHMHLHHA